ncbi:MFS transporter [Herbiconiux moechotypicola]|uniref:MFS transporter n=1 Tax=Herbiconiux moechotypicola TaxID=637393 RepID=A0ABP5QAQ3_9MICO|nr:MFS transporter [Herbiconiux moechotypicola]MCS5729144.1 MFS transporter [Herbiconiux moechotypicola]
MGSQTIARRRVESGADLRTMLACAVVMFASVGIGFYGISVVIDLLIESAGVALGVVSIGTSAFLLAGCVANPLVSVAMQRFGTRRTIALGGVVTVGGLALVTVSSLPAVLIAAFVLIGAGAAACSFLPVSTTLVALPHRTRSLGMTIGYSGGTLGGIVLAPGMIAVAEAAGFVPSVLAAAGVLLVVVVPSALWALPPAPVGAPVVPLTAGPAEIASELSAEAVSPAPPPASGALDLRAALRASSFWWLLVALSLIGATVTAVQLQILTIARFAEIPDAAVVTVVVAASVAVARFAGVAALRVLSTKALSVLACGVQAAAFVVLALARDTTGIVVGAVLVGVSVGVSVLLSPLITVDVVGTAHFARVYGVILAVTGLVNAGAPLVMTALYRPDSGYLVPLVVFAGLSAAAAGAFALVRLRPGS